jgi:hypothetical protein
VRGAVSPKPSTVDYVPAVRRTYVQKIVETRAHATGAVEHRCGVLLDPNSGVVGRIRGREFHLSSDPPEIETSFSFQCTINVRVEIYRIARRPMCAYMCM